MSRKVFCCFPFFNELSILKLKLEELWDSVDYFVLSESNLTHSGKGKPFYFVCGARKFEQYRTKIIVQHLSDTPGSMEELNRIKPDSENHIRVIERVKSAYWFDKNVPSYLRDTYEKESVFRPLQNWCKDEDIIILGDCDEIPSKAVLDTIINNFNENQIYHLEHNVYYYYLNLKTDEPWHGNIVLSYKKFKENSFCEMRQNKQGIFVSGLGWHFSYMGGVDAIRTKIESWGEQSLNQNWVKNDLFNVLPKAMNGRDLFNRPRNFVKQKIDYGTHPRYLVEHQEEFSQLILK